MKNVFLKLLAVQEEIKPIVKDSDNPYFKSKYFDVNKIIEEVKPVLNKAKLVVVQPLVIKEGKSCLETIVADTESGETLHSFVVLPENLEPQKMGSAITYYRRYALQALLFLQAEDDDGNLSSPQNTAGKMTKEEKENFGPKKVATKTAAKKVESEDSPF